jgi:hypothetical protein
MADDSTVDEKAILKAQLDESATDDIDPKFSDIDSKAKFLNGGDHANSKVEVETSSGEDSNIFTFDVTNSFSLSSFSWFIGVFE